MSDDRSTTGRNRESGRSATEGRTATSEGRSTTELRGDSDEPRRWSSNPPGSGPHRAQTMDQRSVPHLLRELSTEGADLLRNEIALARAEMEEKLDHFRSATTSMAVGGILLLAALLTLLWAANIGLTALLVQWMEPDIAAWLSPLILATALGLIGYAMVRSGRNEVSEEGLTPQMTADSLKEDGRWVRRRARQTREDGT